MTILNCFLNVYSMLSNFVEFLEFREFKYCPAYYKKIPLQGALEISNKMMTSDIYENLNLNHSKRVIERPGLFTDTFDNITCCSKSMNTSEDIMNKIETIIKYLIKSPTPKNYSMQIESILSTLASIPCTAASKKLEILSVLLKEAAENLVCCDQIIKEPPAHIQTKTLLNLVSNFIREWGERLCETRSHLKICKFCDRIINDATRQYTEKFCCFEVKHNLDRLLNEWLSLHMTHGVSKFSSPIPTNIAEYKVDYYDESTLQKVNFIRVYNSNNAEYQIIPINKNDISTLEDYYKNRIGPEAKTRNSTEAYKRQRNVSDTFRGSDLRKVGHPTQSGIETGHHDGTADEDLSETNGDRSLRRGKTVASAGAARSDGGTRNSDAMAGRIREKRDNNPHQRKVGEVEDKDQRDRRSAQRDVQEEADRSRITDGKRKGSRDTEDTMAKENGDKRGNPGKNPYQRRREEERESRLLDNNAKKIGRLDRVEEKSASIEISRKTAKRFEVERDENGRSDRRENPENPIARRDRKKEGVDKNEEEGTVHISKNKEPGNKKTMRSLNDTEKGRSTVNEEVEFLTNDEKLKGASMDGRYDSAREKAKTWKANPSNPIEYQLSNVHFVKLGWTVLPITKTMRKIVRYEAKQAKPNLDWFKKYRHKDTEYYDNGLTPFLRFHRDGSGELFYPNGVLAIRVHRPENRKYDMYTVFTPGGKDVLGIERGSQILAIFDTMGYGVVFDVNGMSRLSYNQIGGIFTDNPAGLPLVWTWNANSRESILETVYTEKSTDQLQTEFFPETNKLMKSSGNVKTSISPSSSRNKEKKVAEVQKPVVEKRQEEVGSKWNSNQKFPKENIYHIKVICMKLNEFLGLRIIDRRNIALRFSAKNKSIRIELGTVLNFNKEVACRVIEASDWESDMLRCRFQEKLSKKLESDNSLYDLAKEYRKVKKIAKERKVKIAKYKPFSKINHAFNRCKAKKILSYD